MSISHPDLNPDLLSADEIKAIRRLAAAKKGHMDPEETMAAADQDNPAAPGGYAKGGVVRHASGNKVGAYHGKDKNFAKKAW